MFYHVTTRQEWEVYRRQQVYAPAAFEREGFIHLCHLNQLPGVLDRYYRSVADLLLLHVDEARLSLPIKHEPGTSGELFPHLYGKINKDAVERIDWGRENFLK